VRTFWFRLWKLATQLPNGKAHWQNAAKGLPKVEVPNLSISTSARVLYAATHGRGAYVLSLPKQD
jgi:hypothetical protein